MILNATPIIAVIPSSSIIPIGMITRMPNPTMSVTIAMAPGTRRPLKLLRAAVTLSAPPQICFEIRLICWTECETPMANTRNGTRMASGSSPNPSRWIVANSQTTEVSEQERGRTVRIQERE